MTGTAMPVRFFKDNHLTSRIFTQRIERNSLAQRTRIIRLAYRTACCCRAVELHEKAIATFINKTCSANFGSITLFSIHA